MQLKPMILGILMGLLMLGMMHMALTADTKLGGLALAGFIAAHVFVLVALGFATLFAARLSPRMRAMISRIHKPGFAHFSQMAFAAGAAVLLVHLTLHGGL